MNRMLMTFAILLGMGLFGITLPSSAIGANNAFEVRKEFVAPFLSLPLREFFYPPALNGTNQVRVVVENGESTMHYRFESLAPNTLHTLWFLNLFMVTREDPFLGTSPNSPQGNPYAPWTSGTAGAGFDADGDGILMCGEGIKDFNPVTGQSKIFDPNSFCSDVNGHAHPVIHLPYDVTQRFVPAQNPPLFQTEVATGLDGETEKRRHVIDQTFHRVFEIDDPSRFGFQKLDALGRPELRTFRTAPYVVCAHLDGRLGFTHGHHPGVGPNDGPSSTTAGTDHECLMAAMPTSQARSSDEQ